MGLISPTQVTDGTTADASDVNNPINTIANEFNGNIDNANIKSGAAIDGSKLASNTTIALKPQLAYKFSVYLSANQSFTSTAIVAFDRAAFDTGSNVDLVTHKGRFTAPVSGYYQLNVNVEVSLDSHNNTAFGCTLQQNGAVISESASVNMYAGAYNQGNSTSILVKAMAGDYFECTAIGHASGTNIIGLAANSTFSGFLVSV